jgi:hypothetical protein
MSTLTIVPTAVPARDVRTARPTRGARPAPTGELRLTRRGRLVVFLGALAVVLLLGVLWGAGSVATERPGTPEPTRVVLVAPGDTLYDIAAAVTVDGDVNAMVERIQRLNRMESGMLVAGQEIRVPVTTG